MPRKAIDLTNERFGRLVVKKNVGKARSGNLIWHCHCDCGNTKEVAAGNLRSGVIQSCGCITQEKRARKLLEKVESEIMRENQDFRATP
ncbi:MAG: hypothetical protein FWE25_07460 [Lachnospiraceae bacterium]|nr:hypothetical protein [Lachnospiraceae bacterium]